MNGRESVIDVRDVCFAYGSHEVLHNVSFQIEERDLVAVVGPNGGGKSTLLFLMLGLLEPRLGSVRVFGQAPPAARRRIGYVPQHLEFDPRFPASVFDIVRMGRIEKHLFGFYRRTDNRAAVQALERVGIGALRSRAFSELSGGERQRALIAHALVSDPDLLLLDEPTANVDADSEHALYELLRELNRHKTIVFVSHNVNVVTRHASHVLCVNRTAALHPIGEVMTAAISNAYGGELAVLLHDRACHVTDHSRVMQSGHAAERGEADA